MKKQSVLTGTLVLLIANFATKIIGALFKVPLANIIGKEGMGIFSFAYQIYTFLFIISTSGFPIAISKLISENKSFKKNVLKVSMFVLGILGILESCFLFFTSNIIQKTFFNMNISSSLILKSIIPAVFFIHLVSVFRGYFQGMHNMTPTAISEVVESMAKMLLGLIFANFFMSFSENANLRTHINFQNRQVNSFFTKIYYASGGALIGASIGVFLAFIYLLFVYIKESKKSSPIKVEVLDKKVDNKFIFKKLISMVIPIALSSSIASLTSMIDLTTIMNRLVVNPSVFDKYECLMEDKKFSYNNKNFEDLSESELLSAKANYVYGMYNGYAIPMFNLPLTVLIAISMTIVPAISSLISEKELDKARKITENTLKITGILAIPASVAMSVLSRPILSFVYMGDTDASGILQKLSLSIFFVSLVSVSNTILQSFNRFYIPVLNMLIGGIIKTVLNYYLIPTYGIDAAAVSTIICYFIITLLNLISLRLYVKLKVPISAFIKSLFASIPISFLALYIHDKTFNVLEKFHISEFFNSFGSVIIAIFIFLLVYFPFLFFLRVWKKEDFSLLPNDSIIFKTLRLIKVI